MDRAVFFKWIRLKPFGAALSQSQVDGMNAILNEWFARGLPDLRWLAYMLATAFWETARTMQPIREYGRGKGRPYAPTWYGRGFVQLTWKANYEAMARLLGVALDKNPDLALNIAIAVLVLFEGMTRGKSTRGDFTGKALEDYFHGTVSDPVNARRIINGTDKAATIAAFYAVFLAALEQATIAAGTPVVIAAPPEPVQTPTPAVVEPPPIVPVAPRLTFWARVAVALRAFFGH